MWNFKTFVSSAVAALFLFAGPAQAEQHPDDTADSTARRFFKKHSVRTERLKLAMEPAVMKATGAIGFSGFQTTDDDLIIFAFSYKDAATAKASLAKMKKAMDASATLREPAIGLNHKLVLVVGPPHRTTPDGKVTKRRDRLVKQFEGK